MSARRHTEPSPTPGRSHRSDSRGSAGSYLYAALTNTGRSREHNEDAVLAQPPLFAVADGLGGHDAGEVASAIAIETLLANAPRKPDRAALDRAVRAADRSVERAVAEGIGQAGMGTTMTAMVVGEGRVAIAQVGDSRAYLLRGGRLSQVTEDHSIVAAMVRSGSITEAEAHRHPQRNVITRALGGGTLAAVDTYLFDTLRGDRWLLCSDGLTTMVTNEMLERLLAADPTPTQSAERLIRAANEAGGYDNISVVVVDITEEYVAPSARKSKRRVALGILAWLLGFSLIVGALVGGLWLYALSRSYLGVEPNGTVSVYAGVPGSVGGLVVHDLVESTTVDLAELSSTDQATIASGATYDSVFQAKSALEQMVERGKAQAAFDGSGAGDTGSGGEGSSGEGATGATPTTPTTER